MCKQCILFHFTETHATTSLPSFHGLTCQSVVRTGSSHLILVVDQMSQSLIVYDSKENVRFHFTPIYATVQSFRTIVFVTSVHQQFPEVIDGRILLIESERRSIVLMTMYGGTFASHRFDHHSYGHTGWKTVRIEHDVWYKTGLGEW